MAEVEITCADCSALHVAGRKDAKYCPSCRLLRVLLAAPLSGKGRRCSCGRRFWPQQKTDWGCSVCRQHKGDSVDCAFCKRPGPPPLPKSPVRACLHCVKGIKSKPNVVGGLRNGQRDRRKKNGVTA